ncbi:response regulator [Paenibacillus puerhi]|uniref:response regulator n=1 Tax=Paenibacillus puerhi TaxID=2692622 RepID=UPI001359A79D|nr:response regulator [Paenibacillus puerhi]
MEQTYSMVVIDDMKAVVNGIADRIDWESIGIRVAGTAYNGEEGLRLLQETKPDIIITDIRMPKLSGIEMVENVLSLLPNSKIIFISGHTDFEQAQSAIRMGAFDYVLKPFAPQQIIDLAMKAKSLLDQQHEQRLHTIELERKVRESMPLLRQEYLYLLVRYSSNPQNVKKRWDFLQMDMDAKNCAILVVEIDHFYDNNLALPVNEIELIRFSVQNILEETVRSFTTGIVFRDGVNRLVCILNSDNPDKSIRIAEACCANVASYSKCTVSTGISMTAADLHELPIAYQQAMTALSYSFHTGGNSYFYYGDTIRLQSAVDVRYPAEKEKELFYCIRSGNAEKTVEALEQVFSEWDYLERLPSPDKTKRLYMELVLSCNRSIGEVENKEDRQFIEHKLQELSSPTSSHVGSMRKLVTDICLFYCKLFHNQQVQEAQGAITSSIAYIRDHLHLNESVSDYARQVHLSASYYANLFKKVTGQSVMQFVVNEKIDKAKLLLLEGAPLQDVASAVGYEEKSYFSDVFKKKTGMTPTEFRTLYVSK